MGWKDREVADQAELRDILEKADVCRVAFPPDEGPCLVPLNFGFEWDRVLTLYFHGANLGGGLDRMRRGGRVGFEVDVDTRLRKEGVAGDGGTKYRNLIGIGQLSEVADEEGRRRGLDAILNAILRHYGFQGQTSYGQVSFQNTVVLRLDVEKISGKPGRR